ncbi:MAG TPA: crossover junction endodeoxyribonuclease RuvC [Candidatus Brocadiia bacterium]|nr:crossover junction endodeoxyribonuclease RuvC [Candidatus Brocadiia bacterium]
MAPESETIVMGIDPGSRVAGYGVLRKMRRGIETVAFGVVTAKGNDRGRRLKSIFDGLQAVIAERRPDCISIEETFYGKNVKAAIMMGEARGVAVLTAALNNVPVVEYSPREVKKAVVGMGSAHKEQVQQMMKSLLRLDAIPEPEDAADALALAFCHCNRLAFEEKIAGSRNPIRIYRSIPPPSDKSGEK